MLGAGFERDLGRCAFGAAAGGTQSVDFGMGFASTPMPTFTDNGVAMCDHAADARIG